MPKPKVDMVLGVRKVHNSEDKIEYALKEYNDLNGMHSVAYIYLEYVTQQYYNRIKTDT
jgi:ribosomal protein L20A (L18A)